MPKQEAFIQFQITEAIKHYFENLMAAKVYLSTPAAAAQAKSVEDFGRKPSDVGFYVEGAAVFFLEIKELTMLKPHRGRFTEYKKDQNNMLVTASDNGVDIRYAYNTWPFDRKQEVSKNQVLDRTHVRKAGEMESPIQYEPVHPAQLLREYQML